MLKHFILLQTFINFMLIETGGTDLDQTCDKNQCVIAHLAVPRDGLWILGPSSRFEGIIIAKGMAISVEHQFEVFLDGSSIAQGFVSVGPSKDVPESDVTFQLPLLSFGSHKLRFVVYSADSSAERNTIASESETRFEVVEPPSVLLSFPVEGQRFACSSSDSVSLFFTYDLSYELGPDFLDAGAGFIGAAAIVDGRRDMCSPPPSASGL